MNLNNIKNANDINQSPPNIDFFKMILKEIDLILNNEDENIRPKDRNNLSGGLVNLSTYPKVIILPDLHARKYFLFDVLWWNAFTDNQTSLELLEKKQLALLCLGDGVHSEGIYISRWTKAFDEYRRNYDKSSNMDEEIADSFNLMLAVMCLKIRYKNNFHFLKGNHENIYNETNNGNFAFAKYANEGAMVLSYFRKFYGNEILEFYSRFEKSLPLFVVGKNFLASHAEPEYFFEEERIINYRYEGELIESLTWTENFASASGTIDKLLAYYLKEHQNENTYYFGGHRPITENFFRINNDRYVQIHNPKKEISVVIDSNKKINLNSDVKVVPRDKAYSLKVKEMQE